MDASTREHSRDDAHDREPKPAHFGRSHRRMWLVGAFIVLGLTIGAGGIAWWLQARQFESTDDAFIDSRVVSISPQVSGAIVDVAVTDNELLDEGAKLVSIDDRDYRAAFEQADAQVDQAEATIANIDAQIEAQRAKVEQAEKEVVETQSALTFAQQENDRYQQLFRTGAGTAQRAQQAQSELRQRQAAFDAAKANAIATTKQISVLQSQRAVAAAQLRQARATRDQAKANLDRTSVLAPVRGRVTKLTAAKGAYAQVGQSLLMFVPTEIWVTANFKETQLTYMRPGQSVTIAIDAYPHRTFHGHVDSIQAGSGAAFSLLPPENATGNYVKVVQRVPVKIAFDQPPDVLLGPGMSVMPTIKVR
jgi:membrane fusion protein, multidrug efflux system